ncbi:MAG: PilT/PilU family type 4a pilus ATPase, partial [Actinomycetota bacterium]
MAQTSKQLGEVLLEQGLVTPEQLKFASDEEAKTGKSSWKILLERGILAERDLVKARALQIGLEFVDLQAVAPSPDAVALVPEEVARRQQAVPVRVDGETVVVAMAEPRNHLALEELAGVTGKQVAPAAAYRPDLVAAIEQAYSGTAESAAAPAPAAAGNGANGTPSEMTSFDSDDLPLVEAAPAPEIPVEAAEGEEKEPSLADFLMAVIEGAGSDLHLTSGVPPMIRVHGELQPLRGYRRLLPKDIQDLVYAMLTQRQRESFEDGLELDLSYSLPGKARFRANVFQQRDSVGAVMRLIPFEIKGVDDLGLPPTVKEFAKLRRGLVLVTGITGSGKSTTLAALVDMINRERAEHIMTVEDPIEFLHRHNKSVVNQREVGTDTHGFSNALKHVLRQDPDVILVGEMRDLETISTALTAAETGHLVFATLHTQDTAQTVDRIV